MTNEITSSFTLKSGSHKTAEDGLCLLEAVAFVAGEPHSDHPKCTDPVLGVFGRAINDFMTDDERVLLVPLIPRLIGTTGDHTLSLRRAMLLTDAVIHQIVPIALEACGLNDDARKLRDLNQIQDAESAWSAAESAAESAARSAAESAAAESAARSAARSAAESARSAAESAARSAAESAARSAAWSAARSAAESAAESARSAWSAWSARKSIVTAIIMAFEAAIELG